MDKIKKRLKSKTYWAAIAGTLMTVLEANGTGLSQLLPPESRVWAMMFWPVLMIMLRELTTTALSDK